MDTLIIPGKSIGSLITGIVFFFHSRVFIYGNFIRQQINNSAFPFTYTPKSLFKHF
jgi:hypothetical protein